MLYGVQFPLFVDAFFFSREGFRRACLRQDMKSDGNLAEQNIAKIMKFAWLVPPCAIFITYAAAGFVFRWKGLSSSDPYGQGILITGGACMFELLAEPLYILSQNLFLLKLRLAVVTVAKFFRCITTAILFGVRANMSLRVLKLNCTYIFVYWQRIRICCKAEADNKTNREKSTVIVYERIEEKGHESGFVAGGRKEN